jgi:hypothetical protein
VVLTRQRGLHGSRSLFPPQAPENGAVLPNWEDHMDKPTEEDIIARAYELWEQAGGPPGRDQEFWFQAEKELAGNVTPDEKSKTFLE